MEWILTIVLIISTPQGVVKQESTQGFETRVKCESALKDFYDKTTDKSFVASCDNKRNLPPIKK